MRFAVVGHVEWIEFARVDHVPAAGEIVHAVEAWEEPGGGGAVAAVQLAKLSGGCGFFTALGEDHLGRRSEIELRALGVTVHAARRVGPTRRAVTFIDPTGERTITTLGDRLQPGSEDPLPWSSLSAIDGAFVTAADPEALRSARAARVLVVTSRILDVLAASGVRADAVVGSGHDPAERVDESSGTARPDLVVRTDGSRGGTYETADGATGSYPPVAPSAPVVDTYGSGDSFMAGLTFALALNLQLDEALELAARCGSQAATGRGSFAGQLSAADL
jgi:ribokinase